MHSRTGTFTTSPQMVPPLIVLAGVAGQIVGLFTVRKAFHWPPVIPYLAGGIVGVPIGVALLAYQHYLRCKAVGQFPDEPLVRRNAALIAGVHKDLEEARLDQLVQLFKAKE